MFLCLAAGTQTAAWFVQCLQNYLVYLENGIDEESNICEDTSEQSINGKNDDVEFSGENQNNQKETIEEKVNLPFRK